jgi:hypothetical protein
MSKVGEQLHSRTQSITSDLNDFIDDQKARIIDAASSLNRHLQRSAAEYEQEVRVSATSVINELLSAHLHQLLRQELRQFITQRPIYGGLTNRQLAAANGISIREVKRRKRAGEIV